MSNPITQLSGKPDLMRPVSVRVAPRTAAVAAVAPVTELSPSSSMPPVAFDPGTDSLETAFPSLAVITRRILQGMQDAMDRAIEDAAREAIEAQRTQAQAEAEQQAQREAALEDALASLSKSAQPKPVPGAEKTEAAPQVEVVGSDRPTGEDGVQLSRPAGRDVPADIGPGFESRPSLDRDAAGAVLSEVTQTVRKAPREDVEQVHRPENLAYSALLLNG